MTKLFTKQGEEEFTRMRMCIVQQMIRLIFCASAMILTSSSSSG
ncbi:hypothetical protein PO124_23125 [Bacillus licheniformis]|nr:hypothetical protein [Bacillus licheniformis]